MQQKQDAVRSFLLKKGHYHSLSDNTAPPIYIPLSLSNTSCSIPLYTDFPSPVNKEKICHSLHKTLELLLFAPLVANSIQ